MVRIEWLGAMSDIPHSSIRNNMERLMGNSTDSPEPAKKYAIPVSLTERQVLPY